MPNKRERKQMKAAVERIPPKRATISPWQLLRGQIGIYVEACIVDSWKGGGDPADFEIKKLRMHLERAVLDSIIEKMERELGPAP